MLRLYWWPQTRAARAVWMLEEIGAEYELLPLDIDDEVSRADPAFRAASPLGKVPALLHEDTAVADSAAICLYLADRFPEAGLAPAVEDPRRGRYLYWTVFVPGVLEPCMGEKADGRAANRRRNGWADFETMVAALEQGVGEGPWLLGERFAAADLMVGSTLHFMRRFGMLPRSRRLEAYADRCVARPAFRRAQEREAAAATAPR